MSPSKYLFFFCRPFILFCLFKVTIYMKQSLPTGKHLLCLFSSNQKGEEDEDDDGEKIYEKEFTYRNLQHALSYTFTIFCFPQLLWYSSSSFFYLFTSLFSSSTSCTFQMYSCSMVDDSIHIKRYALTSNEIVSWCTNTT